LNNILLQTKQENGADKSESARRVSVPDRIVRELVRAVHAGELVPGQRLVEIDLVNRFGVSRGPLREAFKRLASMGLVELAPYQGARIRQVGREEALGKLVILEVLLGLAARLAAEHIDEADNRKRFARAAKQFMKLREKRGWREFMSARDSFYHELIQIAGNRDLSNQIELVQLHLLRALIKEIGDEDRDRQDAFHEKIILQINAGDAKGAEATMRKRVRAMIPIYESLPDAPQLPSDFE
jgi:DNA-binding GntR family transcriptional regulator